MFSFGAIREAIELQVCCGQVANRNVRIDAHAKAREGAKRRIARHMNVGVEEFVVAAVPLGLKLECELPHFLLLGEFE